MPPVAYLEMDFFLLLTLKLSWRGTMWSVCLPGDVGEEIGTRLFHFITFHEFVNFLVQSGYFFRWIVNDDVH